MALQRFIGGEVTMSKAYAHGILQSKLRHCGTAGSGKVHPVHESAGPAQECSSAGPVRGPTNRVQFPEPVAGRVEASPKREAFSRYGLRVRLPPSRPRP